MENKIFVIYIGVAGIRSEDIENFCKVVAGKISPISVESEIIVIPTQSPHTRIECINPQYITDSELINKHNELMQELHVQLEHQIKQLKEI